MYISVNLSGYKGKAPNLFTLSQNYRHFISSFMSFHGLNVEISEPVKDLLLFDLDPSYHDSQLAPTLLKLFYLIHGALPQDEVSNIRILDNYRFYFYHFDIIISLNIN